MAPTSHRRRRAGLPSGSNWAKSRQSMTTQNEEVRKFLAAAGAKGGKAKSPKKAAHLASIASKGGKTVTAKKREHLKKALAARWAKAKAKSLTK
jgi:hypothetical protein